jgi:DNA repair exonuclease SbcCD ATPase subunit
MTLTRIDIADYQSLAKATIPVGRLTTVTGPTGAGKSSVRRAALLAAQNARGVDFIRRGAARAAVVLSFDSPDGPFTVAIRRTAAGRGDLYRVTRADGTSKEYTKLGGGVPDAVAELLRLGPLNFVGQLDPPYLLSATGTDVARTLGELTNVSLVFRAAAEAGRRRKGFDRDARSADTRLEALRAQEEGFAGLPAQLDAIRQAADGVDHMTRMEGNLLRLGGLIRRMDELAGKLAAARAAAARAAPPDLGRLERGLATYQRLQGLIGRQEEAEAELARCQARAADALRRERQAHTAFRTELEAAGTCPLCEQGIPAAG